jgi:two-component system, chemotaxis family, chemotaxis protein CheY
VKLIFIFGEIMANILIVDDSLMIRRLIKMIVEKSGHNVIAEAETGEEAYIKYKVFRPDLVTMDISMPGMDGIQAVKKIIGSFPEANIIMISAITQKELVFEALESGAKRYIFKPLTDEKVDFVIGQALLPQLA